MVSSKTTGTAEAKTPFGNSFLLSNFTTIKKSDLISPPASKIGFHLSIP